MGSRARVIFSTLWWVLLGGWLGSQVFFVAAVTPAVLASGLDAHSGGALVSRTLSALEWAGIALAPGLAALAWISGRGRLVISLLIVLGALTAYSHFGVTVALAELRPPWGTPEEAARFAGLHRRSVALFGAIGVGTLAAGLAAAWEDLRGAAAGRAPPA